MVALWQLCFGMLSRVQYCACQVLPGIDEVAADVALHFQCVLETSCLAMFESWTQPPDIVPAALAGHALHGLLHQVLVLQGADNCDMMCRCGCCSESALQPLLAQQGSRLPDWSLLVLFLAEQYYYFLQDTQHNSSSSNGDACGSRWGPYIRSLPRHPVGTVLDWKAGEVRWGELG
jgi:hypothetical protein